MALNNRILVISEKRCGSCKETRPAEEFSKDKNSKSGLACYCKQCHKEKTHAWRNSPDQKKKARLRSKKWALDNPDRVLENDRRKNLIKKYGITLEQYDDMCSKQRGVCKICQGSCKTGYRLAVDHCHTTGEIRGLLCQPCNTALGSARDDIDTLKKMIKYLEGEL